MNVLARSLSAASLLLVLVSACGNQGAGERCDRKNQDLDCDDGLLCQPSPDVAYGLCCPQFGSGIAVPTVCYGLGNGNGNSAPDAGSVGGDGSVVDESSTTGSDAAGAADAGGAQ
jgi:hypothetical protein